MQFAELVVDAQMLKTDYPPDVRATTEYEVEVIPVIDGVQYPLQVQETVKAID